MDLSKIPFYGAHKKFILRSNKEIKDGYDNGEWWMLLTYFVLLVATATFIYWSGRTLYYGAYPKPKNNEMVVNNYTVEAGANLISYPNKNQTENSNENKIAVILKKEGELIPSPKIAIAENKDKPTQKLEDGLYHTNYLFIVGFPPDFVKELKIIRVISPRDINCTSGNFRETAVGVSGSLEGRVVYPVEVGCVSKNPILFDSNFPKFELEMNIVYFKDSL